MTRSTLALSLILFAAGTCCGALVPGARTASREAKSQQQRIAREIQQELLGELLRAPAGYAAGDALPDEMVPPEQPPLQGEDVGLPPAEALARIGDQMRRVEDLLAQADLSDETDQKQRQIIDELDRLIWQLEEQQQQQQQQNQQSSSSGQSQQGSQGRAGQQSGTQPGGGQGGASGEGNAGGGTARGGQPAGSRVASRALLQSTEGALQRIQSLIKTVWGHLPDRVRQNVPNVSDERFLPRYERLIEEYFRRLAEEPQELR